MRGLPFPEIDVMGMPVAQVDAGALLDHVFAELRAGRGGWLVTANLDFLKRHRRDATARALYDSADIRVADGMPLVWAARLAGDDLPERVAGSSLLLPIAARANSEQRSIYLLGGTETGASGAQRILATSYPTLRIERSSPYVSSPPSTADVETIADALSQATPDIVLIGMGSPKQELLIAALRTRFPTTWMIGVGISFSLLAGEVHQAPVWVSQVGLEWVHRMAQEPGRLWRRYLVDGIPFALELFWWALAKRLRPPVR